jgi:hypothetical protein
MEHCEQQQIVALCLRQLTALQGLLALLCHSNWMAPRPAQQQTLPASWSSDAANAEGTTLSQLLLFLRVCSSWHAARLCCRPLHVMIARC